MSDNKSLHSAAFNFMSLNRGGVDSRTGLYTLSIVLPDLKSHALMGPDFKVALYYSPLNTADSGFGKGWNLEQTQYTSHNQVLTLSTGESFRLEDSNREDKRLNIPEQKIARFDVYKEGDAGLDKTRRLRVVHRSGLKEILEMQDVDNTIALPVSVLVMGRKLKLDYIPFGQFYLLSSISEVNEGVKDTLLLSLERNSADVTIKEHSLANGSEVRFVSTLSNTDNRVSKISLPTANSANWEFEYKDDPTRTYLSIVRVRTPTGATELLDYTDGGHRFPSAARREALPRVNRHKTIPGKNLPQLGIKHALIDIGYDYVNADEQGWGNNNFLGDDNTPWGEDDGRDNLYKREGAYLYGSLETHYVDDKPVKVIERHFNRFHLLTAEMARQGNTLQETRNTYPVDQEKPFVQQPPNFQLAFKESQSWALLDNSRDPRTQAVESRYDNYGNLVWRKRVDKVEEDHVWYPAEGEGTACPPDPEGFVRHLKQTTITPAPTDFGQALPLTTLYTYISLPAVRDSEYEANDPDHSWRNYGKHVVEGQTLGNGSQALEGSYFEYFNDPEDAFLHGRLKARELNYPGTEPDEVISTTTTYSYDEIEDDVSGESALETVETLVGFDGESKTITLLHSMLNGEPLLNRDDNDVKIRYVYDALRRVTVETVDPGGANEASRRYEYHLCAHDEDVAEQAMFDVKTVKTRTIVDGFNNAVYEERDDVDSKLFAGAPRPIYRASYNALGQLESQTEIDWHEAWKLELTQKFEYDDWGEQTCEIGPDGVRDYTVTDPLGTKEHIGPIIRQWRVSNAGEESGVTETWLNLFEEPVRIERYVREGSDPAKKRQISLKVQHYDGLGRLHQERDGEGDKTRINTYRYDAFDRLVLHTLPGNAEVTRTYAAHSREDLPITIKVGPVLLGEQTFDGLGRRTHAITGYRDQTFKYKPGERQPYLMIAPSGDEVTYDYLPSVGEEPTHRRLAGVDANYTYDPKNGRLVEFDEPGYKVERAYFSNGDVKSEDRTVDGELYAMHYGYSYRSRMRSYSDVLGQEQVYEHDEFGRLAQTRLHEPASKRRRRTGELGPILLQSDFTYDPFGRMESFVTQDIRGGTQLKTSLTYDAFDREEVRTFDFGGDTVQRLTQCYDSFDCMEQRLLGEYDRDGKLLRDLRDEQYRYDLRGRLVSYQCKAFENPDDPDDHYWPVDPYGKRIKGQTFGFDDLDNITLVFTTFEGGSNRARYFFGDPAKRQDPAQLLQITNNHADYPKVIDLEYDKNGNLTTDDAGRSLRYDALNRLIQVTLASTSANEPGESVKYLYDAQNILSGTQPE